MSSTTAFNENLDDIFKEVFQSIAKTATPYELRKLENDYSAFSNLEISQFSDKVETNKKNTQDQQQKGNKNFEDFEVKLMIQLLSEHEYEKEKIDRLQNRKISTLTLSTLETLNKDFQNSKEPQKDKKFNNQIVNLLASGNPLLASNLIQNNSKKNFLKS